MRIGGDGAKQVAAREVVRRHGTDSVPDLGVRRQRKFVGGLARSRFMGKSANVVVAGEVSGTVLIVVAE